MRKTILITGSTDGIGLETAKALLKAGHLVLVHGRNPDKLARVSQELTALGEHESYQADLSNFAEVTALADAIQSKHSQLDVLINNAGVFKMANPNTVYGLDARFVVNTLSPYLLTKKLLPLLSQGGRVVNLSSAAQAPVEISALKGEFQLPDMGAYAQSKLALTMWSQVMGQELKDKGTLVVSVNPGSLLSTKMVKEAFGSSRSSVDVGVDILVRASLSDEFDSAWGRYFDNDAQRFAEPHPEAAQASKVAEVVNTIESLLAQHHT